MASVALPPQPSPISFARVPHPAHRHRLLRPNSASSAPVPSPTLERRVIRPGVGPTPQRWKHHLLRPSAACSSPAPSPPPQRWQHDLLRTVFTARCHRPSPVLYGSVHHRLDAPPSGILPSSSTHPRLERCRDPSARDQILELLLPATREWAGGVRGHEMHSNLVDFSSTRGEFPVASTTFPQLDGTCKEIMPKQLLNRTVDLGAGLLPLLVATLPSAALWLVSAGGLAVLWAVSTDSFNAGGLGGERVVASGALWQTLFSSAAALHVPSAPSHIP